MLALSFSLTIALTLARLACSHLPIALIYLDQNPLLTPLKKRDKNDRIRDKHKEKKDQKHKDRKNEKEWDKGRTSQDRKAEGLSQGHNELHIKESLQKTEEELGKRSKDEGVENPMVGRKFEGAAGTANASLENERVAASQAFSVQVVSVQRRNDRSENFAISLQKEAEYVRTEATMDKERSRMHGSRDTVPSRNHAISRSTESVSDLVIRKTGGGSTADMEKEKCGERSVVSNSVVPGPDRRKVLENDERPGKIPRLWELHLTAPSSISLRPDRLLENKERLVNGNVISKYLSQIYTVPKMVEYPELDNQEWLFNLHDSLQKSKIELKAEKIPQVFAQATRIDSADILALPYVVPF
ncbi:hypothetical protein MA16_Dca027348 [Dendrobium catenatum]|uniref:Uncharacterized protein n=1 Tax=Dendrobium catenatum TaxID=906689 RepID=A0A2I0VVI1_9ASPA|nr:hypothetical protein MA16_Dca027348 [Dendrobium catenatum]